MLLRRSTCLALATSSVALLATVGTDHRPAPAGDPEPASGQHARGTSTDGYGSADRIAAWLGWRGPRVAATPKRTPESGGGSGALRDRDGDLLPDSVEHVLLLDPTNRDSDDDGTDDFLHAAQGRYADLGSSGAPAPAMDHAFRVVATAEPNGAGANDVWVHLLFRFLGTSTAPLQDLRPFLDHWGYNLPLEPVLGQGDLEIRSRQHPTEGLYVRASVQLVAEGTLRTLMPCTIGARVVLGGRAVTSGAYLQHVDGHTVAYVANGPDTGMLQTLAIPRNDDPFWTSNRICLLRLAVVASTAGGTYAEVRRADCIMGRPNTSCPPTCASSVGRIVFFPDGMRTVTSGGD